MSDHRRQPPAPQMDPSAPTAYASRHKAVSQDDAAVLTHWLTADVTASVHLLRQVRTRPDYFGAHLSPLVVLAYAGVESFQRLPFIDPGSASVNLGLVAVTERGVQIPRVEQAQSLSLRQLAAALAEAVQRADENPVAAAPSPLVIADVGAYGIDGCTPAVAGESSALLCIGAITRKPWVCEVEGEERLSIRDVCTLSLSFDQRFIESERAARFLADVAAGLNDPSRFFLG